MGRPRTIGLALLLGAYSAYLFTHSSPAAGGSDSSGYLNSAKSLADWRPVQPVQGLSRLDLDASFLPAFLPLGYVPGPQSGTMSPFYPPGLPLHFLLAGRLLGWDAGPSVIAPVCAVLSLWLIFLLGRDLGLSAAGAIGASSILAVHPAFLFEALQPMSDVPATFWSLAAILASRRSREKPLWAALAGTCFGVALLVRPTSLLLLVAIAVYLGARGKRLGLFLLGGLLPAAVFLLYNHAAFGRPWATGYGRAGLLDLMAWSNFSARIRHYSHWLSATLTGLVLLGWLVSPFDRRIARRDRAALVVWFATFFLFYCFYRPYDTWWYLRFLLPAFPAMIIAFLLVGDHVVDVVKERTGFGRIARVMAIAGVLIVLGLEFRQTRRLHATRIAKEESKYPDACRWAESRLPTGSLVIAMQVSGALRYYTPLLFARWDQLTPERSEVLLAAARRRGYRAYALLYPFEETEMPKHVPGPWQEVDRLRGVSLWALENRTGADRP